MKLAVSGNTLQVSEVEQLRASNAEEFRTTVLASLAGPLNGIDIDLSKMQVLDSFGLGALISLEKLATRRSQREITVRLINPTPSVQQVLELTRVHRLLEVVKIDV